MAILRFSRILAAGALVGATWAAAQPVQEVGVPALRLSPALSSVPSEAGEVTAVPQPGSPGFTERTRQPVEVLQRTREQRERDLLDALSKARQQQQATADIEHRLAQVRNERYANPVVYSFSALLAIAMAGAALLWRRMRMQSRAIDPANGGRHGPEPA